MKKIYILLTIFCVLVACKKNEVDFSIEPAAPRAGESVRFGNLSTAGEEWAWSFGDGSTSTLKSPTHIYKMPGKYVVSLKVDNKRQWTVVKELTVYDTVPTFVVSDSVFYIYKDYTFTANLYNPYNYEVEYQWLTNDFFNLDIWDDEYEPYAWKSDDTQSSQSSSITYYFTHPMDSVDIYLRVVLNGDTTVVKKSFFVQDRATKSLLIRTDRYDYRQRLFGERAEKMKIDPTASALLDAEQDTIQTYNGKEFRLSELQTILPEIVGFHIAHRKIYYRAYSNDAAKQGLWVANIDGSNQVRIDDCECRAMTIDTDDNRIYWVQPEGLIMYMPLIGSDNNQFVTTPTLLSLMNDIEKLAIDHDLK